MLVVPMESGAPDPRSMKKTICHPPTIPLTTELPPFRKRRPFPNGKSYAALDRKSAGMVPAVGEISDLQSYGFWATPRFVRFLDQVRLAIMVRPFEKRLVTVVCS